MKYASLFQWYISYIYDVHSNYAPQGEIQLTRIFFFPTYTCMQFHLEI